MTVSTGQNPLQRSDPGFRWGDRTLVMGVLNLTPDSFSDGGRLQSAHQAETQAALMLAQGAAVLDLGGQSTRPGAEAVGPEREWKRLRAALLEIRQNHPRACLSIDTFEPAVAEEALAAGADWINDVRGASQGRDPAMLALVAEAGCPYVAMHSRGDSQTMDGLTRYTDVVAEVREGLLKATDEALAAGVMAAQVIWDPGLGFAKTTSQNLELLRGLPRLRSEGFPLLVGPSRKRFIGAVMNEPRPRARLWGTAAVCGQVIAQGGDVLRVHDVGPIVQTARMADALWRPNVHRLHTQFHLEH